MQLPENKTGENRKAVPVRGGSVLHVYMCVKQNLPRCEKSSQKEYKDQKIWREEKLQLLEASTYLQ